MVREIQEGNNQGNQQDDAGTASQVHYDWGEVLEKVIPDLPKRPTPIYVDDCMVIMDPTKPVNGKPLWK